MGEARKRGTREARISAVRAQQQQSAMAPPAIVCNGCQQTLPGVDALDVRALPGLTQAYRAHCAACDQDTWAVRGTAPAVRAFYATLEKASGQAVLLGTAAASNNPGK